MELCSYGCGNVARYFFKNGRSCCSKSTSGCPFLKKVNRIKNVGRKLSAETKIKIGDSKRGKRRVFTEEWKRHLSDSAKGKIPWNKELTKEIDIRVLKQRSFGMKGKHQTEEFKEKHRERMKNFRHSDDTKMRLSKIRIDRGLSKGKNNPMFSKKHSESSKQLMSGSKSLMFLAGGNPNWRGGISCEPYCFEWNSEEFKDYIKYRDEFKCNNTNCSQKSKCLVVHHIDYNKKNCDIKNLITVCNGCNSKANFNREQWIEFYKEIIKRKYSVYSNYMS